MKTLIVTDHSELRDDLLAAVRQAGFSACSTKTISAAASEPSTEGLSLIITTWRMGDGDDSDFCRHWRNTNLSPKPLLIILTTDCPPGELQLLLDAGADDFLILPQQKDLLPLRLKIAARQIQDRAESARSEKQLRASNERFRLAVCGANDGLWDAQPFGDMHLIHLDPNLTVWYSPRCKELLGYSDDEFPNLLGSWESHLHPDDRGRVFDALTAHIQQQKPYDVEYRLRTKSGQFRWFSARGQAVWDENGRALRMAGSLRDITQTKEDEAKLESSEAKWRSLVENAPDIIMLADLDGTIRFINRKTATATQSIGRNLLDYIDEPFKPVMLKALADVAATGKLQRFEVHGQSEQGVGTLWYANRLGPVFQSGKVESVVLIATDITVRRIAEQRLERERRLLRQLLDLQERERQLVSYEIHDGLVQYLTAGLMHLEAFANSHQEVNPQALADYETGADLIRDGLTEARRLISGLRPPILDEQGVVAALEYLVNESRKQIPQIEFVNHAHFARLAAPLEVALFRITQEALTNIRKHSGAKTARVELLQHGDWVRLLVRDSGCGFDPATVREERFGLQGIRQRARLLGTAATIESAPGKGTTLVVDFPILPDPNSAES